jgi:hypothetical protein
MGNLIFETKKEDGIFFSFGIDSEGDMYFQTANSPECYSYYQYVYWAKETDFSKDIGLIGQTLIDSESFQRFIRVNIANQYPEKGQDISFEYFPLKYSKVIDEYRSFTIRFPHDTFVADTFILHDVKFSMYGKWPEVEGVNFKLPGGIVVEFDKNLGQEIKELADSHPDIFSFKKQYRELRYKIKNKLVEYFKSIKPRNGEIYEGIIMKIDDKLVKLCLDLNKDDFPLNDKIFGEVN